MKKLLSLLLVLSLLLSVTAAFAEEDSTFTVACVPTGMKTGVSITPCVVVMRPLLALVFASL